MCKGFEIVDAKFPTIETTRALIGGIEVTPRSIEFDWRGECQKNTQVCNVRIKVLKKKFRVQNSNSRVCQQIGCAL